MTYNRCLLTLSSSKALQIHKQLSDQTQVQKLGTRKNTISIPVLTMDEAVTFLLLFTVVEPKATGSPGKHIRLHKDPLLISVGLVRFTPCLLIHGVTASITPRIRPQKAQITRSNMIRIMDKDTFIRQEDEDADKDVDTIFIMLHVFLTHSLLSTSNRNQQTLLQMHCQRLLTPITLI